jgi:hypothetical protein
MMLMSLVTDPQYRLPFGSVAWRSDVPEDDMPTLVAPSFTAFAQMLADRLYGGELTWAFGWEGQDRPEDPNHVEYWLVAVRRR